MSLHGTFDGSGHGDSVVANSAGSSYSCIQTALQGRACVVDGLSSGRLVNTVQARGFSRGQFRCVGGCMVAC